jgi:hypothetical protein
MAVGASEAESPAFARAGSSGRVLALARPAGPRGIKLVISDAH